MKPRHDPDECQVCLEVGHMAGLVSPDEFAAMLNRNAEALYLHLKKWAPQFAGWAAPAAHYARAQRKRRSRVAA